MRACELDVTVRKPGNVSVASPGHRMRAEQFVASAVAAAAALFETRTTVGERIERAVAATHAAVGCNTNLGIVLLMAPLAAAAERRGALDSEAALQGALSDVLAALNPADARAAYRAITMANPAGLGRVAEADVSFVPRIGLREAMALDHLQAYIPREVQESYQQKGEAVTAPPAQV